MLILVVFGALLGAAWFGARTYFFTYKSPMILLPAGCSIFPANNIWNTRIDRLPVDANSQAYVQTIGANAPLHADFSDEFGYPFGVVDGDVAETSVVFKASGNESDKGPYRIPKTIPVEDEGDRHLLAIDRAKCRLYELFATEASDAGWKADSGINIDLRSNALRPDGWTSADAAGLPMLPGLVRYQEVTDGEILHALRFTARHTRAAHVWPARHDASRSQDPRHPPMGERFRLRSSFDSNGLSLESRVIVKALQEYGMFLADNGGDWYLSGAIDSRWNPRIVSDLKRIKGSDFEAVDSTVLMKDKDSGEARR
jgi:hypothetical protein